MMFMVHLDLVKRIYNLEDKDVNSNSDSDSIATLMCEYHLLRPWLYEAVYGYERIV